MNTTLEDGRFCSWPIDVLGPGRLPPHLITHNANKSWNYAALAR